MTQAVPEMTPYSTAVPFFVGAPSSWMPDEDRERIRAYQVYEQMYWNVPDTFRVQARGSENKAIYLPTSRIVVDTLNRYIGTGLDFQIEGSTSDQISETVRMAFQRLFRRERWRTQFSSNKKFGIIRGDWAFHIFADPEKPEGTRISIKGLDPASLFKVVDEDDLDRVQAWHIVEQFIDEETGDAMMRRQTYSRGPDWSDPAADDGKIWFSQLVFEVDEWSDPSASPIEQETLPFALPDAITALPIYHIAHQEEPQNPWGSSELRGHERIIASLNQSISDEDVTLALEGLGMYATTSGPPVDEESGEETEWRLGPGRVVEVAGADGQKVKDIFDRISGIGSVEPFQSHLKFLLGMLYEATKANDVARGSVDASTAESGIALALRMFPLLQHAKEVDDSIEDRLLQMYHDLKGWLQAYEGIAIPEEVEIVPTFGPKMPENRSAMVNEILSIVQAKVASTEWGRNELAKWGYEFGADEDNDILEVDAARAAAADPFGARADEELDEQEAGDDGQA